MQNKNTVCLPVEIIRNVNLSPRARIVWAELSLLPKGAVGEFVVKQKELAKLLGICVSTLRRAVKSLEDAGLIQYVGLFEKKYKKYVFKNCHPASPDCHPGEGRGLEQNDLKKLDASLRWHDKTETKSEIQNPPAPIAELPFRLRFRFDGPVTSDQRCTIIYAQNIFKSYEESWKKRYPLLNGKNRRPVLDSGLIEYIVLTEPRNIGGNKMMEVIENELQRFSEGIIAPDMSAQAVV